MFKKQEKKKRKGNKKLYLSTIKGGSDSTMIVVQAKNNSPIVTAIKQGKGHVVPFSNFHTIAEAITTGNPMDVRESDIEKMEDDVRNLLKNI